MAPSFALGFQCAGIYQRPDLSDLYSRQALADTDSVLRSYTTFPEGWNRSSGVCHRSRSRRVRRSRTLSGVGRLVTISHRPLLVVQLDHSQWWKQARPQVPTATCRGGAGCPVVPLTTTPLCCGGRRSQGEEQPRVLASCSFQVRLVVAGVGERCWHWHCRARLSNSKLLQEKVVRVVGLHTYDSTSRHGTTHTINVNGPRSGWAVWWGGGPARAHAHNKQFRL